MNTNIKEAKQFLKLFLFKLLILMMKLIYFYYFFNHPEFVVGKSSFITSVNEAARLRC